VPAEALHRHPGCFLTATCIPAVPGDGVHVCVAVSASGVSNDPPKMRRELTLQHLLGSENVNEFHQEGERNIRQDADRYDLGPESRLSQDGSERLLLNDWCSLVQGLVIFIPFRCFLDMKWSAF
jgi:hypothetical protein